LLLSFADSGVMIVGCLAENWNEWVSESENLAHVGTCLKCLELVILPLEKCIYYGFILYTVCPYLGATPHWKFTSIRGEPLFFPQCCSSGKGPLSGAGPRIEPGNLPNGRQLAGTPNSLLRHNPPSLLRTQFVLLAFCVCTA
jgi:hypothetical protein